MQPGRTATAPTLSPEASVRRRVAALLEARQQLPRGRDRTRGPGSRWSRRCAPDGQGGKLETGRLPSPAATPVTGRDACRQTRACATPADPPTVEGIIVVMREAGSGPYADGLRALIGILWRALLRISEALALNESDLDPQTGSVLVRDGCPGVSSAGWQPHDGSPTQHQRCEVLNR
jgi:hypothetical protein